MFYLDITNYQGKSEQRISDKTRLQLCAQQTTEQLPPLLIRIEAPSQSKVIVVTVFHLEGETTKWLALKPSTIFTLYFNAEVPVKFQIEDRHAKEIDPEFYQVLQETIRREDLKQVWFIITNHEIS